MAFEGACYHCNASLRLDRVGFREECPECDGELHACVQCAHYAPGKPHDCNETGIEPVFDKEQNNRCEWFQFGGRSSAKTVDKAGADALLQQLLDQQKS